MDAPCTETAPLCVSTSSLAYAHALLLAVQVMLCLLSAMHELGTITACCSTWHLCMVMKVGLVQ
jgi:hypothetical protein